MADSPLRSMLLAVKCVANGRPVPRSSDMAAVCSAQAPAEYFSVLAVRRLAELPPALLQLAGVPLRDLDIELLSSRTYSIDELPKAFASGSKGSAAA